MNVVLRICRQLLRFCKFLRISDFVNLLLLKSVYEPHPDHKERDAYHYYKGPYGYNSYI